MEHTKDSDCTVDPETLLCFECGVMHGEECPDCGGRGYHKDICPDLLRPAMSAGSLFTFTVRRRDKNAAIDVLKVTHSKHHADSGAVENCGCAIGMTYRFVAGLNVEAA